MRINVSNELTKDTMLGHVVLECLTNTIGAGKAFENFLATKKKTKKGWVFNIKLTLDGKELNLRKFIDHWQKQVDDRIDEYITKKAQDIIDNKFVDVEDLLHDLNNRVKKEVEKRHEDWEKV